MVDRTGPEWRGTLPDGREVEYVDARVADITPDGDLAVDVTVSVAGNLETHRVVLDRQVALDAYERGDRRGGSKMAQAETDATILCAHADRNGEGAHWKREGEPCPLAVAGPGHVEDVPVSASEPNPLSMRTNPVVPVSAEPPHSATAVSDARLKRPIQRACDRCTQGVMDVDNPHLSGACECPCHRPIGPETPAQLPPESH